MIIYSGQEGILFADIFFFEKWVDRVINISRVVC